MDERNELSRVSQKYLTRYREITENMICKMNGADFTDSISQNFINQMIPHHEAAIEMSQNLLRYTTNLPLQNLADKIISGQSREVEKMKSMLKKCSAFKNPKQEFFYYIQQNRSIMQNMFLSMKNAKRLNCINESFILEMIPHHEGAVQMAQNALKYRLCPELTPLLRGIIKTQTEEICEMKKIYKELTE